MIRERERKKEGTKKIKHKSLIEIAFEENVEMFVFDIFKHFWISPSLTFWYGQIFVVFVCKTSLYELLHGL